MKRPMPSVLSIAITITVVAVAAPSAQAAVGDNFSFAPTSANGVSAPAFGSATTAWWAGVCDLHAGEATIGTRPVTRFPGCIDQPQSRAPVFATDQTLPPLAPNVIPNTTSTGSGPDGWLTNDSVFNGLPLLVTGPAWRLEDVDAAGAHPDGSAAVWFSRAADRPVGDNIGVAGGPDGAPRDITVTLPPGLIGNPNAVPKCPSSALQTVPTTCPPKTQVGVVSAVVGAVTGVFPVYNVEPRVGKTAEFVVSGAGRGISLITNVPVTAVARTNDDFGVDAMVISIPGGFGLLAQTFTLWGVPWAASHDQYRTPPGYCHSQGSTPFGDNAWETTGMSTQGLPGGVSAGCSQEPQSYDPSWGPIRPFLTTQAECSPVRPKTRIRATTWHTDAVASAISDAPEVEDCEKLPFEPDFDLRTTTGQADSATGLDVDLRIPQNNDPPTSVAHNPDDVTGAPAHWKSNDGLAVAHLKDSVVTLPAGVALNPSGATGLRACPDVAIGIRDATTNPLLFNNSDPFDGDAADGVECPSESIIGEAEVVTPLLEEHLTGQVVLGEPRSIKPESGDMLRLFIVVRSRERGLVAKVFGRVFVDPDSGQLKAVFENNPRIPFEDLRLRFKGGPKGVLATPQRCGSAPRYRWSSTFTPWTAAHGGGGPIRDLGGGFDIGGDCFFGFAPSLSAGMSISAAKASGDFSFRFSRRDGEQWLKGLRTTLPQGLLASVRGVPLCTSAQAAGGSCPAASRIGVVDASAGSGDPFVLERKGEVFLTEGYKGGEYGLLARVPVIAGPFRGQWELTPIVVRQAIHVDRSTAQVTVISDDLPRIWHGVPLRTREITVKVDRDRFMRNPSDCTAKLIDATFISMEDSQARGASRFQASGCAQLPFKPRLALTLIGRRQLRTGKHPGVRAVVRQARPEAGIEKTVVRLPKSLALDVNNAQALCEFADGTKPDLENYCPKGSIIGRARAETPLLNDPLVGNVYFVKNIRIDPRTGNQIRTLPMIIVALRGEISINLRGESDTTKGGKLVNTFDNVPDAPVSRFNLNIKGGATGILAVTRTRRARINLCSKPKSHVAEADIDGQNGKRHDIDVRLKVPCAKRQRKAKAKTKRRGTLVQRKVARRR